MPLAPSLADLGLRIVLTAIACTLIGLERGESGKAAGLRTTLLVGLAACLAMIQVNLLLPISGKPPSSFVVMDLMRLPLGILSGVGFIGAGAILRRNTMVIGVTTAATLWYVTILGLCFGGGQIWLGIAGLLLGLAVVQGLRLVEPRLPRDQQGTLSIRWDRSRVDERTLLTDAVQPPMRLVRVSSNISNVTGMNELYLQLRWRALESDVGVPEMVKNLSVRDGVMHVNWTVNGMSEGG